MAVYRAGHSSEALTGNNPTKNTPLLGGFFFSCDQSLAKTMYEK